MLDDDSHKKYGEILEAAGELLDSYVIPIFCLNKFERPEMEGTGFFIEHNLRIYFITASHVIDAIQSTNSRFVIAINTEMFSLPLLGSKRTVNTKDAVADSQFDLAVILVSPNLDYYKQCLELAIPISKTTLSKNFPKVDMQILQGFPSSKNKTAKCLSNTKHFSSVLWTYSFNFSANCDYSSFNKIKGSHYPIHWPKKVQGQKLQGKEAQAQGQIGVHPRGCSGGPYWFIPDKSKISEFYLAGVFIEYYERSEIAFVTKIEHVIELIVQYDT